VFDEDSGQVGCVPIGGRQSQLLQPTIDGGSVGGVTMSGFAEEDLVDSGPAVSNAMNFVRDVLAIGSAAMLIGCAKRAFDMSLEYLKFRQQFGVAIGSFQALQHRAASLHVMLASSQSFLVEASDCFDGPNRTAVCTAARARAADCALQVVKEAVQFHGAIGFADEHDIGLYFRRVVALAAWHGNSSRWRKEYFGEVGHRFADVHS
jgi:alkylation response protein AidB-like acyl-CoA dehydrogenase